MARWIGINLNQGNADGFGRWYIGSAQDKKMRRKQKAWSKNS